MWRCDLDNAPIHTGILEGLGGEVTSREFSDTFIRADSEEIRAEEMNYEKSV